MNNQLGLDFLTNLGGPTFWWIVLAVALGVHAPFFVGLALTGVAIVLLVALFPFLFLAAMAYEYPGNAVSIVLFVMVIYGCYHLIVF